MKLVVDTSELFSFFNELSKARELSLIPALELHSPSFSLDELKNKKIKGVSNLGVVSGTSAPNREIEKIRKYFIS